MPENTKIKQLFDNIAPKYDLMNHLMSFNIDKIWRRKAVRRIIDTQRQLDILDLATGTGDFAIAIAEKAAPGSSVTGIDLSEKMVEVGNRKMRNKHLEHTELQIGNAESIPFPDSTFDRVSVAFGIRNYENLERGLREACRVLKPGGRFVVLELSSPDNRFLLWAYKIYALKFLPWLGAKISGNRAAYTYLPDSVLKFPKPAQLIPTIKSAGFSTCEAHSFTFGVCRMYVAEKN